MSFLAAYKLSGQDNDTFMYAGYNAGDLCPVCKYRKELTKYNPDYVPRIQMPDLSATYDGFYIVSEKFRKLIEELTSGAFFDEFTTSKDYFNLRPERTVVFDFEQTGTRFVNACPECGSFESVVGTGNPPYINVSAPILDGVFRTDLCFASGNEKHPLLIAGIGTKTALENCGLQGLEFSEVHAISGPG